MYFAFFFNLVIENATVAENSPISIVPLSVTFVRVASQPGHTAARGAWLISSSIFSTSASCMSLSSAVLIVLSSTEVCVV